MRFNGILKWDKALSFLLILVLGLTMVPILSDAGDYDAADSPIDNNTFTSGIDVDLFNYGKGINANADNYNYGFFDGHNQTNIDKNSGKQLLSGPNAIAKNILSEAGYPDLLNGKGDLSYLFAPNSTVDTTSNYALRYTNEGNYTKKHFNVNQDHNGLFQKDSDGYFYYNSALNSAYFNPTTGSFELYDYLIRPSYIEGNTNSVQSKNFLPFNKASNKVSATKIDSKNVYSTIARGNNSLNSMNDEEKGTYVTDLWFGMTVDFEFLQPTGGKVNEKDMIFEFEGDDDVLVYIDGVKVLDLGGTHEAQKGTINFATGEVNNRYDSGNNTDTRYKTTLKEIFTNAKGSSYVAENFEGNVFKDYSEHDFKFYYLERGGNISFCSLKFNMPIIENPLPLTVEKEVSGDAASLDDDFTFVLETSSSEAVSPAANIQYIKTDASGTTSAGITNGNGEFLLKGGEKADFTTYLNQNIKEKFYYRVTEKNIDITDYPVTEAVNQISGYETETVTRTGSDDSLSTGIWQAWSRSTVKFTNIYDPMDFKLTKEVEDTDTADGLNPTGSEIFSFRVYINGSETPYTGDFYIGATKYTAEDGIIELTNGQTAVIQDLYEGYTVRAEEFALPRYFEAENSDQNLTMTVGDDNNLTFTNLYKRGKLDVTKSNSPTESEAIIELGDEIEYTLKVQNNGNATMSGVWVRDYVPEYTELVDSSITGDGTYNASTGAIDWFIDTLAVGESNSKILKFTVKYISQAEMGYEIENTAFYKETETTDPAIGINEEEPPEEESNTVINPTGIRQYNIEKSNSHQNKMGAGDQVTYYIDVENTGNITFDAIYVKDYIPEHTKYISGTGITGNDDTGNYTSWVINDLSPGQTETVSFTVELEDGYVNEYIIKNQAFHGTTDEYGETTNEVQNETKLYSYNAVKSADHENMLTAGDEVTYTITVTNDGEAVLKNLKILDYIPDDTSYVADSADNNGVYDPLTKSVSWTVAELDAEDSISVSFTVTLNDDYKQGEKIRNVAFTGIDKPNNETEEVIHDTAVLSYTAEKINSHQEALSAGDTVTYSILVTNTGEATISGININDAIPGYTTLVNNSITGDGKYDLLSNSINWIVDNLAVGETTTLSFTVTLNNTFPEDYIVKNIATTWVAGEEEQPTNEVQNDTTAVKPDIADPVEDDGNVLGEEASDDPQQKVLGEEAKTDDSMTSTQALLIMGGAAILVLLCGLWRVTRREE